MTRSDSLTPGRRANMTPHVAVNLERADGSVINGRTGRHRGYRVSQRIRKRIEERFGWAMTVGRILQTMFRGIRGVEQQFKLNMLTTSIVRMARMPEASPRFAFRGAA